MTQSLILIGFMGAGKTAVGEQLAAQCQLPFLDMDAQIEAVAGESITTLFETRGEERFRDLESQVLADACRFEGVVATGGGILDRPENVACLAAADAQVIYLSADFATTMARLLQEKQRPLLEQKSARAFFELWESRQARYQAAADITITTGQKTVSRIVRELVDWLSATEPVASTLAELRSQIDNYDRQILTAIDKRLGVVSAVAAYKSTCNMAVVQEGRMQAMKAALLADFADANCLSGESIAQVLALLLSLGIAHESDQMT